MSQDTSSHVSAGLVSSGKYDDKTGYRGLLADDSFTTLNACAVGLVGSGSPLPPPAETSIPERIRLYRSKAGATSSLYTYPVTPYSA